MRRRFPPRHRTISIHALREESDAAINGDWSGVWISIHALREESDKKYRVTGEVRVKFQSTLSVRRATPDNRLG